MMTNINVHKIELHRNTWTEQINTAMTVNGGDLENATACMYIMHFLSFFWKVLFALIPPAAICSGWLRFFTSLGIIGLMATIIGDLASIFGCLIRLDDTVTGIIKIIVIIELIERLLLKSFPESCASPLLCTGPVFSILSNSVRFLNLSLTFETVYIGILLCVCFFSLKTMVKSDFASQTFSWSYD